MRRLGPVLVLLLVVAFAPAITAQDAGVAPCEIRGHLTIADVHVVSEGGVLSVVTIDDRDVWLTPIRRDLFQVRTEGEGAAIAGRAERAIPLSLAAERTFGDVVTVPAGTRVDELDPQHGTLRARVPIHEGVSLHRVTLECRDLVASEPVDAALDSASLLRGPSWRARVSRLRMHRAPSDELSPITLALEAASRTRVAWTERERREGWVRVQALLAHARVDGWVRDTDLQHP